MRGGERFEAYWNQAPDQKGGRVYALFAFRSTIYAQDLAGGQTRRNTEELELYVFARVGRAAAGHNMAEAELSEQRLAELIARLGDKVGFGGRSGNWRERPGLPLCPAPNCHRNIRRIKWPVDWQSSRVMAQQYTCRAQQSWTTTTR